MSKIQGICISEKRGTEKHCVEEAMLIEDWGIENDAHAGHWHRQVSLLSLEKIEEFRKKGANVDFGAFGENLIIDGFDFRNLPVMTRFQIGEAILEMTQIGKECHSHCQIYKRVGDCIMPREGVFARVIKGGKIKVNDEVQLIENKSHLLTAAILTMSDKGSQGLREDTSGKTILRILKDHHYQVEEYMILPDNQKLLERTLKQLSDQRQINLIITTGGTGFSPRDFTPEATLNVMTRNAPGISEAIRYESMKYTKRAMLSRGASVIRNQTLIVNLPGSEKAVKESMDIIIDTLEHGLKVLNDDVHECGRQ